MKMTTDEALRILEENSYLVETIDPVTVTTVAAAAIRDNVNESINVTDAINLLNELAFVSKRRDNEVL